MKNGNYNRVLIVLAIIAALLLGSIGPYNKMVPLRNKVYEQSAQIENVLQGRLEKIPNLVKAAKTYMEHEEAIFAAIDDSQIKLEIAIKSGDMEKIAEAEDKSSKAIKDLDNVSELYPELASDKVFVALMDEIAGSVNRIQQERRTYNEVVTAYNNAIETFPEVMYAKVFGFKPAQYFQAEAEAHNNDVVDFKN